MSAAARQVGAGVWANRLHPTRIRKLAGWLMVGVAAFFVELGLIGVMLEWLGWRLEIASAIAAELTILGRFLVMDRWVFGHARPTWERVARYHGACAGSLVVSWLALNGSATFLGVPYPVATLLGTMASFAWSLPSNFFWVWRRRRAAA